MSGAVIWITGLPSSGKSRFARELARRLSACGVPSCTLDGDVVRKALVPEPGYSPSARDDFYRTLGNLALELAQQGLSVLVPATAHRREYREHVRAAAPHFLEVWLDVPLAACRQRDTKRLYADFAAGALSGVPGEDLVYEAPERADVVAHGGSDEAALERALALVLAWRGAAPCA